MNTIFFDLDGTLLPLEENEFIKKYFYFLSKRFLKHGFSQETFINVIWAGTKAMLMNDGKRTNEEVFWDKFCDLTSLKKEEVEKEFEEFYLNDFSLVKDACQPNPLAVTTIKLLKEKGYELVLATNPVFPLIATMERIKWAGLNQKDFIYISTFENSNYCKPNPKYYHSILAIIGKEPSECIMIGNSVKEDMMTKEIGFEVFLLTDNLLNVDNEDISKFKHGNFVDLFEFAKSLPKIKK